MVQQARRDLLICALLLVATLAAYSSVLSNGFVSYDDNVYVTENVHVRDGLSAAGARWALTATYATNWHPLTWLSHMLDCQLFGLRPGPHHLDSVLLHALSSIFLFLALRRMTAAVWKSGFVAALFALHPLHVESVAWVAERKDVLSGLFWMLTLGAWALYAERRRARWYLAALACFALGLTAKPMLVTIPFVLLLIDYWPLSRLRAGRWIAEAPDARDALSGLILEKLPFLALSAASCVVTYLVQSRGGAVTAVQKLPIGARIANAFISYVRYLGKTVWPADLTVFYVHPVTWPFWLVASSVLLLLAVTALAIAQARKRPYIAVGWLWYVGTLVPVIGFVQVGRQAMADRYTYLPLIGIFLVLAWGTEVLTSGLGRRKELLAAGAALALAGAGSTTWVQARYWKDTITLFTRAVALDPDNFLAHNDLGVALASQGRMDEAARHYAEALRVLPNDTTVHANLAGLLLKQGRHHEAIVHLERAIESRPDHAELEANLGLALAMEGRFEEAIVHDRKALAIDPGSAKAHEYLGGALEARGRIDEAIAAYEEAVRLKPDDAETWNNLGAALAGGGHYEAAIERYRRALAAKPDYAEAHNNLGAALGALKRYPEALSEYAEAVRLKPDYADAHSNMGSILLFQGRLAEAADQLEEAVRLAPGAAESHYLLGEALLRQGRREEARAQYLETLRLKPGHGPAQVRLRSVESTRP